MITVPYCSRQASVGCLVWLAIRIGWCLTSPDNLSWPAKPWHEYSLNIKLCTYPCFQHGHLSPSELAFNGNTTALPTGRLH